MTPTRKTRGMTEHLEVIDDPRTGKNIRHTLKDIVLLSVCGVIAGNESWDEIEEYGIWKEQWLKKFLELPNGVPSHDTLRRVFTRIKPEQLEIMFREWTKELYLNHKDPEQKSLIAIDGKTLRRSHDRYHNQSVAHLVSAWLSDHSLVLGQVKTDEKSNEITAIPELLEALEIQDSVITIDAMGCQSTIATLIKKKNADYILAVKDNQKQIHEQLKWFFDDIQLPSDVDTGLVNHETTFTKDHGRIERRDYLISSEIDWMAKELEGFPDVKSIGMSRCRRTVGNKTSVEKRYYITSLDPDCELFMKAVRSHWGIENKVHWVLDMVFREDESRMRTGHLATNMSVLRRIAMNVVRRDATSKKSLKLRRKIAFMRDDYLEQLLFSPDPIT